MELIDFLASDFLNGLRQQMKAALLDYSELPFRNGISYAELFDIYDGVEVGIDEIDISAGGLLYYKGVLVSLNIQDVFQRKGYDEHLPKLHICDCQKIKDMKNAGRLQRYISSGKHHRMREIRFVGNHQHSVKTERSNLDVCKYCLAQIKWQGYHTGLPSTEKDHSAKSFNLAEFYQHYEPQFYQEMIDVLYSDQDKVPLNAYQHNWAYISYEFRKSKRWRCESCRKDCSANHAELHTHHINGNKADNHRNNLSALCYDCHASQPMHEHMRK